MDHIDLQILSILQENANVTIADIAAYIGLSQTPSWKRIQKLESSGILLKRVALVSPAKVGLGISACIEIKTGEQLPEAIEAFTKQVAAMPEVVEFLRTSGETNYMLHVVATDLKTYEAVYKRLTGIIPLRNVSAHLVLQRIKSTTALPLSICTHEEIALPASPKAKVSFDRAPKSKL